MRSCQSHLHPRDRGALHLVFYRHRGKWLASQMHVWVNMWQACTLSKCDCSRHSAVGGSSRSGWWIAVVVEIQFLLCSRRHGRRLLFLEPRQKWRVSSWSTPAAEFWREATHKCCLLPGWPAVQGSQPSPAWGRLQKLIPWEIPKKENCVVKKQMHGWTVFSDLSQAQATNTRGYFSDQNYLGWPRFPVS